MLARLLHLILQKVWPLCDKGLAKMEKEVHLWAEDTNRKRVSIDGSVLHPKAESPYKDSNKGSPKTVTTSHSLQVRDDHADPGIGSNGEI